MRRRRGEPVDAFDLALDALEDARRREDLVEWVAIPLTRGFVARIDSADWSLVADYKWFVMEKAGGRKYARAAVRGSRGEQVSMHRLILGLPKGFPCVDHVDGDGLNNTRVNLRVCTNSQNIANARPFRRECSSRYKGVRVYKGAWDARICVNGTRRLIGRFHDEVAAAMAYDQAAREAFGDFARLNFPDVRSDDEWFPAPMPEVGPVDQEEG
jgi:hypothetical protein